MGRMKLDKDLGPDSEDGFQTDDEENQAERDGDSWDEEDDDEVNDIGAGADDLSRNSSCVHDSGAPSWPQSYRRYASSDKFLDGFKFSQDKRLPIISIQKIATTGAGFLFNQTACHISGDGQTSKQPLAAVICSVLLEIFVTEFPPPQKHCFLPQATLNGINVLCSIGILAAPWAIHWTGWSSLLVLVLTGFLLNVV